jgi:hypothetical protein
VDNAIGIINVLILIANIGIFCATLKLYTEYFKERKISERSVPKKTEDDGVWKSTTITELPTQHVAKVVDLPSGSKIREAVKIAKQIKKISFKDEEEYHLFGNNIRAAVKLVRRK